MNPDELVRRVVAALVDRTLAFALGQRVPTRVRPWPSAPLGPGGLALTLTTLDGRRPALWLLPSATCDAWSAGWDEKKLFLLLTGGLDRWQLLAAANGEEALPGFPVPSSWETSDALGWSRVGAAYRWFEVRTKDAVAWLGLEEAWASRSGDALVADVEVRARVREDVLGEACGREGAERPWEPSVRGIMPLPSDFALGPCLLAGQPIFRAADPDAGEIQSTEVLLIHEFGWDERRFSVAYRLGSGEDPHHLADLVNQAGRLLPFAALVGRTPGPEQWSLVEGVVGTTEGWLRLDAGYEPSGPDWDVFLPPELLNELSTFGTMPWDWRHLWAGADNLLQVLLSALHRLSLHAPPGFARWAGLGWSAQWFAEASLSSPPASGMAVADLWSVLSGREKVLLVQNVLSVGSGLGPLRGLFAWVEEAESGPVWFVPPGFDPDEFGALLPALAREDWGRRPWQTRDEFEQRNEAALSLVWQAVKSGRLPLSERALSVLRVGFADPHRAWKERTVRAATDPSWANVLRDEPDPQVGAALQRSGASVLALALLHDETAGALVRLRTSAVFWSEFEEKRLGWKQRTAADGPDLEAWAQARATVANELAPWLSGDRS